MSLYIDDRAGSDNLIKLFPQGLVEVCRLEFGDVMFIGKGEDGTPTPVGIEFKTVEDVLKCICDGRFSGKQLPGLITEYPGNYWLLIEGDTRIGIEEQLQIQWRQRYWSDVKVGSRGFKYAEYEGWITTHINKAGLKVKQVKDRRETKHWIMTQYKWWVEKGWDKHKSHLAQDKSGRPMQLTRPSYLREFAAILPGIGWGKAAAVEAHFDTIADAARADTDKWCNVAGIGKKMANRIVEAIHDGRPTKT